MPASLCQPEHSCGHTSVLVQCKTSHRHRRYLLSCSNSPKGPSAARIGGPAGRGQRSGCEDGRKEIGPAEAGLKNYSLHRSVCRYQIWYPPNAATGDHAGVIVGRGVIGISVNGMAVYTTSPPVIVKTDSMDRIRSDGTVM